MKKTALEDAGKVAYFWFSEQCLGILDVLYVLMIPIFLNIWNIKVTTFQSYYSRYILLSIKLLPSL